MSKVTTTMAGLPHLVGSEVGVSDWLPVDQEVISAFGRLTRDEQWIHLDPDRAASGPFGSTIAHGYLTLSLLSGLFMDVLEVSDATAGVNYGLNKVRFPAPLPVDSRVRARISLLSVDPIEGGLQMLVEAVIEREGGDKPVCVAQPIFRYYQ